jgi:hypothetical protein
MVIKRPCEFRRLDLWFTRVDRNLVSIELKSYTSNALGCTEIFTGVTRDS